MKAYSLDFREKIIDVYLMERVSIRKLAKRFGVATSFVEKLLKRLRETGDILPKPHGGGPQPKLNENQLKLVTALVEADNDATLDELRERLAAETSILISRSTMGRVMQKLGFTRKKNAARHRGGESTGATSLACLLAAHSRHCPRKLSVHG